MFLRSRVDARDHRVQTDREMIPSFADHCETDAGVKTSQIQIVVHCIIEQLYDNMYFGDLSTQLAASEEMKIYE